MQNDPQSNVPPMRAFHVMTKPVGPLCNLDCRYCFYLEKEGLFPSRTGRHMSNEVLERFVRDYIQCQNGPEIHFAWQGGEPTLAGLDFYRTVVALQRQYGDGRPIHNALQTNGTLLDDDWCRFLADERFLVGLSLDGPEHIHNRYRTDSRGTGSFAQVMRGLEKLKKHGAEFNTLTCITRESPGEAVEIYRFLKKQGVTFMQFIPIVERAGGSGEKEAGLTLAAPPAPHAEADAEAVTPWSVTPKGFGRFMCSIFDEWVKADIGRIFVNLFDSALTAWCGEEPQLCTYARRCGQALAMEQDGGIYSCDHYVYPSHYLGNVQETALPDIVYSERQTAFGKAKEEALTEYCRRCEYLFACNGDCPKHRFIRTPSGEPGLSYLCEGFRIFFAHVDPSMRAMAERVRNGRPAAGIMQRDAASAAPGRNDPCPCGSGKKYKKCCGAR